MRGVEDVPERVTVLGDVEHERIDVSSLTLAAEREQRQLGALPQSACVPAHDEAFGALLLRHPRARAVCHLDEHGDTVAFGDRLAQPSCTPHGS